MSTTANLIKRQLDQLRRVGVGSDAVLTLLRPSAEGGYEPVLVVFDGGWTLEDSPAGQLQQLVVVEHGDLTREALLEARLFDVDGQVYAVANGYGPQAPSPKAQAQEWTFPVAPTGEAR